MKPRSDRLQSMATERASCCPSIKPYPLLCVDTSTCAQACTHKRMPTARHMCVGCRRLLTAWALSSLHVFIVCWFACAFLPSSVCWQTPSPTFHSGEPALLLTLGEVGPWLTVESVVIASKLAKGDTGRCWEMKGSLPWPWSRAGLHTHLVW